MIFSFCLNGLHFNAVFPKKHIIFYVDVTGWKFEVIVLKS